MEINHHFPLSLSLFKVSVFMLCLIAICCYENSLSSLRSLKEEQDINKIKITVYTIQPWTSLRCHFIQSHIGRMYVGLAVTCHLHFWRNDRDLLRATAVTPGWSGYRNKSQHRKLTLAREENSPAAPAGTGTRDLSITSPTLYH